jgi:hypothetical protein
LILAIFTSAVAELLDFVRKIKGIFSHNWQKLLFHKFYKISGKIRINAGCLSIMTISPYDVSAD